MKYKFSYVVIYFISGERFFHRFSVEEKDSANNLFHLRCEMNAGPCFLLFRTESLFDLKEYVLDYGL